MQTHRARGTWNRGSLLALVGIALLTLLTFGVRQVGLGWGLPHHTEPDAEIGTQLEYLRGHRKRKKRLSDYSSYPLLPAYVAYATTEALERGDPEETLSVQEHLELASDDYVDVRRTISWLSVLAVPATFLIASRFLGAGWSLFAAALVATSLLTTMFSQQARPHAASMSLVAWTVLLCMRMRERAGAGDYLAAAVVAGLAIGSLQSGVAVLIPLAAAHLLSRRRWIDPRVLLPVVAVAASIRIFYPFSFGTTYGAEPDAPGVEGDAVVVGNHAVELSWFDGTGFVRVLRALWWYEPALLGLLAVSLLTWAVQRCPLPARGTRARGDLLVVLSYAVPYLLVIGLFRETFERFLLPLLPFLACAAAWGGARLATGRRGRAVSAVLVASLALPTAASLRLVWLRTQPDTMQQAAEWLTEHAGKDEPIFLSPIPSWGRGDSSLELPLMRTAESIEKSGIRLVSHYGTWHRYQTRLKAAARPEQLFSIRWLLLRPRGIGKGPDGSNIKYLKQDPMAFFNDSGTEGLFAIEPYVHRTAQRTVAVLTAAIQDLGVEQARFSPDASQWDTGLPFECQDRDEDGGTWPHVTLRCLTARSIGPVVEIYRLDPERVHEARERKSLVFPGTVTGPGGPGAE